MRNIRVWHIMTLIGGLALAACNKTPIPELAKGNDPIYTLSGEVDGEEIDYSVGLESVVMNRGVTNEGGLLTYYGEMESVLDNEKIRIEFIQQETPIGTRGIEIFGNLNVPFFVHDSAVVGFDFGGLVGGQNGFFFLLTEDDVLVKDATHVVREFGFVNRRAVFLDVNTEPYNFTIKHGFANQELFSEYATEGMEDTIYLNSKEVYGLNEWYIDGVLVGTEVDYFGPIGVGIHRINHRVTDANGNQSETDGFVRFEDGSQLWNMNVVYEDGQDFENYNYGRVIISMFKNGEWYSSDFAVENKGEEVIVSNIESVTLEDDQLPLVSYDINFDAVLYNKSKSEFLTLSNMDGKFIVGLE